MGSGSKVQGFRGSKVQGFKGGGGQGRAPLLEHALWSSGTETALAVEVTALATLANLCLLQRVEATADRSVSVNSAASCKKTEQVEAEDPR